MKILKSEVQFCKKYENIEVGGHGCENIEVRGNRCEHIEVRDKRCEY